MPVRATSLLLASALCASLAACGGDGPTRSASSTATPSATRSPSPSALPTRVTSPSPSPSPSPSASARTSAVAVYYVRDTGPTGARLYREFHRHPVSDDPARGAVEALLGDEPEDADYTSFWAPDTGVNDVTVEGDTATVDLSRGPANPSGNAPLETAALQQLVHTVTAAVPSVRSVRLLVAGEPAGDSGAGVRRAPAAQILGPVWVLEPTEGATLRRGDSFGGEASVVEATVNWEWAQGDTVVAKGFSTATEGAPGRGPWSATVDVPPGDYELRAFESSAEDGRPTFVDSKQVKVAG